MRVSTKSLSWVEDLVMGMFSGGVHDDDQLMVVRTMSGRGKLLVMSDAALRRSTRHRLEVRVTPEQDAVIRQAADLEDRTVTAFVLDTVTARARDVIEQHRDVVLSNDAFERFVAELDKPATTVPQLSELFTRHPKLPEA